MKKNIFTLLVFVSLTLSGCRDWLDINENPNYVSKADKTTLLPTVALMTADKVGYELTLTGYFWAQYTVQNRNTSQYTTVMNYDLNTQSAYFTSPWSYLYVRVLPSVRTILKQCEGESGVSNFVLEAKTMLAYNLYLLTSLYDKVAYTDGYLNPENTTPGFDSGEQMQGIITGILEEIRSMNAEQLAADEQANTSVKADMIFGGDVEQWVKFANTLYLRVLLRDFDTNRSKIQSLLAENNLLDTQDAAFDNFSNEADKSNPLYESDRRQLNTDQNIRCCSDILGVLSATDSRLSYYYEGGATGVAYGTTPTPAEANRLQLGATDPVYFATIDEACFLKAEAYARLNDAANARSNYEEAIRAAFARCGCTGADELIAGDYAFTGGTTEQMVEQIINHKWASNVRCMPIESWFDMNRTGYPTRGTTITASEGVLGGFPCRFLYPYNSTDYNPSAPQVEPLTAKMWWHK